MSLSLDPTKPPDTGESPTLGAMRIRNVSAFLLQLLGFAGTTAVSLTTAPVVSTDTTTGAMTLAGKLTLGADGASGKDAVAFDQFVLSPGTAGYCIFPGGFKVAWATAGAIGNGSIMTLTTNFTQFNWEVVGIPQNQGTTPAYSNLYVTPVSTNQVLINMTGGPVTMLVIAVGS